MGEARKSYGETGRFRKLAAVSAAGMLAVTAAAGNLARTADAAPSHAASAEVGEKSRNWLMGWMDGKMAQAVVDINKLRVSHKGSVQKRLVKLKGQERVEYEMMMVEPNPLGEKSYTILVMEVEPGRKTPDYTLFIPNNPSPNLNLSPGAAHPDMLEIGRVFGSQGSYLLDIYDPHGKKYEEYFMDESLPPTSRDTQTYEDTAGLVAGFIELKKDSYKKPPSA